MPITSESTITRSDQSLATESPTRMPLSLRFRLLAGVNAAVGVLLILSLIADYRRELGHHLRHEKAALLAEAGTIAATLPALQPINVGSIQRLLDSILQGMNASDAPHHRILVEWNGMEIEPNFAGEISDGKPSFPQRLSIPNSRRDSRTVRNVEEFVVGTCSNGEFTVHVAEPLKAIRMEIGMESVWRFLEMALAGLVAMAIVYYILLRALVRPMEHLSKTVQEIGRGKLGTQTEEYGTAELTVLARSINAMSATLANLDQERRIQMSKARRLQRHLLADWPPIPGLTIERRFLSATDVTGDYHDAYALPDGEWLFCIADVTGHGIPAAMTASMLKILFYQVAATANDPQVILKKLNSSLGSVVIPGDFATMLIVHWQPGKSQIRFANAGHEPGLLIRSSGETILLESDGFMVGAVPDAQWSLHCVPVFSRDRLFMYTDGAVEIFDSKRELFGRSRLHEAVVSQAAVSPEIAMKAVIDRLDEFRGNHPFADDVTLLIMEFSGATDAVNAQTA